MSARVAAQGLEFGVWLVLARRLGASDVGVLAVAMVLLRMGGLLGDWGAAFRGAREVASLGVSSPVVVGLVRRRERVSGLLAAVWVIGALLVVPELAPMGLVVVARGSGRDWMALGEDRRSASVVSPLVQSTVLVAGGVVSGSIMSASLAFTVAYGIGWVISLGLNRLPQGIETSPATRVDPWYLFAGLADQVLISGDVVVLAVLRTTGEAGVYAVLYRYPAAWLTIIGLAVSSAIPAAARRARERSLTRAEVSRAMRRGLYGGGVLVLITPMAVASVGLLFGPGFEVGRMALVILLLAAAVTTVSAPLRVLYAARGSDRNMALVTGAAAAGNLVANLATVAEWGLTAAAVTTLLSQASMFGFFVWWARRQADSPGSVAQQPAVRLTTST